MRIAVGGGLVLAVLVGLLPTLASTGPGTKWVVGRINAELPGRVAVEDLNLSWFGGQSLEGVMLFDPAGVKVASLDRVALEDVGLLGLVRGSSDLGVVAMSGGVVDIVEDEDGQTNLDRALGTAMLKPADAGAHADDRSTSSPDRSQSKSKNEQNVGVLPADLRLAFALRDMTLRMTGPTLPDVRVAVPEATLNARGPGALSFSFDADVARGDDEGHARFVGSMSDLFDAAGRLTLAAARFDVEGVVERVPLAALDRLAKTGGRLQTVIGPTLDGEISLQGPTAALEGRVSLTSENLNLRQGLTADDQRLGVTQESRSTLRITPESWAAMMGEGAELPTLVEPFSLSFGVSDLAVPRSGSSIDLDATRFTAAVNLPPSDAMHLDWPGRGRVVVEGLTASVASEAVSRSVTAALGLTVATQGQTGTTALAVEVRPGAAGWSAPRINGGLRSLPLPVLDVLLGQGERLTATLGPQLDLDLLAESDGRGRYALTVDFNRTSGDETPSTSPLIGTLSGTYSPGGAVSLKTDERMRLTVRPEAFAAMMRPVAAAAEMGESVGLSLPQPADVWADVDLRFALIPGPGLRFDPLRTSAVLRIELPETQLVDEWYGRRFMIRSGRLAIDAPDPRLPITATLGFETDDGASGTGRLDADVHLTGAMLDDGYLQMERGKVSGEIELDRVPTAVFDALSRQRGYAVAAFGQNLSATISLTDWNYADGGSARGELESANGSLLSFSGTDRDGFFVIDKPVTFFLNQTPELSTKIMRFVNPILLPAVVSATVPMTVTIDDDGFRMPTRNFAAALINADIQVQMGTVKIVPSVSPVDKILPQLQALGLIERASLYEAKVSPITLRMRDGVFGYQDLSFKIDDVTLGFGGTISLVDQSIDMGMSLGGKAIEGDPLVRRLMGEGIRIRGTVQEPQVNLASVLDAFSKEQLPQTLGGLLEGVLQKELKRGQTPTKDRDAPVKEKSDTAPNASGQNQGGNDPEVGPGQALGGLLGELLNRELDKARQRNQNDKDKDK